MKPINAILTTLVTLTLLIIVAVIIYATTNDEKTVTNVMNLCSFVASVLIGIEAKRIESHKYKGGASSGVWFITSLLFSFIIVFPLFLIHRGKIKLGTAVIKKEGEKKEMPFWKILLIIIFAMIAIMILAVIFSAYIGR